jgi:integrase
MPREVEEPRLFERKPRYDKTGKLTHKGTWIIIHGGKHTSTGCSFSSPEESKVAKQEALLKLHEYNVERYSKVEIKDGLLASEVKIGDLILYYLQEQEEDIGTMTKSRRKEHIDQISRLSAFWGDKLVSDIKRKTSKEYQKDRKQSVVRNELILLRAIVNFCAKEGKVKKYDDELNYAIPEPLVSRMHYFTEREVRKLYQVAMWKRHTFNGQPTHKVSEHIGKFIATAVLTGTRTNRIQTASFVQEPGRPWVDLENGIFYRAAEGEMVPTNKQADPVMIPDPLLRLMKRWHHGRGAMKGTRYLIEYQGRPVDCRKGFYTLKNEVFGEERAAKVNRHTLKHTCVTLLLQHGVSVEEVADFVSTTPEIIRKVYKHVIPGEYSSVHQVFAKKPKVGATTRHERNKAA